MNILITENQYRRLIESDIEINNKPAKDFDEIYGTSLSHTYDFGDDLTSDDVWEIWLSCRDNGDCDRIKQLIMDLPKTFPYYDMKKLNTEQKVWIIQGMASEFNPADIVYFAVDKVAYVNNQIQKSLENKLPKEVSDNIRWVLSPHSVDEIKNRFGINEI